VQVQQLADEHERQLLVLEETQQALVAAAEQQEKQQEEMVRIELALRIEALRREQEIKAAQEKAEKVRRALAEAKDIDALLKCQEEIDSQRQEVEAKQSEVVAAQKIAVQQEAEMLDKEEQVCARVDCKTGSVVQFERGCVLVHFGLTNPVL
jgi:hypothetical protein